MAWDMACLMRKHMHTKDPFPLPSSQAALRRDRWGGRGLNEENHPEDETYGGQKSRQKCEWWGDSPHAGLQGPHSRRYLEFDCAQCQGGFFPRALIRYATCAPLSAPRTNHTARHYIPATPYNPAYKNISPSLLLCFPQACVMGLNLFRPRHIARAVLARRVGRGVICGKLTFVYAAMLQRGQMSIFRVDMGGGVGVCWGWR